MVDLVYLPPTSIISGAVGTLEDSTDRQESDDGTVYVVEQFPRRRRRWNLSWDAIEDSDALEIVEDLFEVNGQKHPFLFVPPRLRDYQITNQIIGTGDGAETEFQLVKTVVTRDVANATVRAISHDMLYPLSSSSVPERNNADTIHITLNNIVETGWTLGPLGLITMTAPPANGVVVRATFQYATPVQWFSDAIDITMKETNSQQELRSATVIEVF